MDRQSVSNIIQRGGTILGTSRCPDFLLSETRAAAAAVLRRRGVEGRVVLGGDGTLRGAKALADEQGVRIVAVPGTIDNDVYGTDYTIGFDTAINTALEAIDRIRDTAHSLERVHFVEVMGRQSGFIALEVGLAGGAEEIVIPEAPTSVGAIAENIKIGMEKGKHGVIVVVAEGDESGGAFNLARRVSEHFPLEYRVTVLGHIQRGGVPSARDRVLASRLGAAAVEALVEGVAGVMVGEMGGRICRTPLEETWTRLKPPPLEDMSLAAVLSE
jgi:6-phosphofructokinase 1